MMVEVSFVVALVETVVVETEVEEIFDFDEYYYCYYY